MTDRDKGLCCAIKGLKLADPGKVRHRTRIVMQEGMDLVLYCESKDAPSQEVCWFVEVLHAFDCIPPSLEESFHA
jgi:hypothetical protein